MQKDYFFLLIALFEAPQKGIQLYAIMQQQIGSSVILFYHAPKYSVIS